MASETHGATGKRARFAPGQVVRHRMFGYRGLVFDVDPVYAHDAEWYAAMAITSPPRDEPWYHLLVDGAEYITYVAERNLTDCDEPADTIDNPRLPEYFLRDRGHVSMRAPIN